MNCLAPHWTGQMEVAYTEYKLEEVKEALEHAGDTGINTKVLLQMPIWT